MKPSTYPKVHLYIVCLISLLFACNKSETSTTERIIEPSKERAEIQNETVQEENPIEEETILPNVQKNKSEIEPNSQDLIDQNDSVPNTFLSTEVVQRKKVSYSAIQFIQPQTTTIESAQRHVYFGDSPMTKVYSDISPVLQTFVFDPEEMNRLVSTQGTQILIPSNSLVDMMGNAVRGDVILELIEVNSMKDFITAELATMSGETLLMSQGMMYLNVKQNNQELKIEKNKEIVVSQAVMEDLFANGGMNMFLGDGKNWEVDSSMTELDYLIPYPMDLLYPQGNDYAMAHCWSYGPNIPDDEEPLTAYYDTTVLSMTDKRFENSIVATQEFADYFHFYKSMVHNTSYFERKPFLLDKVDCKLEQFNSRIFEIIALNYTKSWADIDSLIRDYYVDYLDQNHDELLTFCEEVNTHKRNHYSNWTDTNYHYDFRKESLSQKHMALLSRVEKVSTKPVKSINDFGVDLYSSDAYNQLLSQGVSEQEANDILVYHFRREAVIRELEDEKKRIENDKYIRKVYNQTFSTSQLGWINCDRFFNSPYAIEADIAVNTNNKAKIDYVDCSLIIPSYNSKLSAFKSGKGHYNFTKKEGVYTKLPRGVDAIIICIGATAEDNIYYGSKKIKIGAKLDVNVSMKKIKKAHLEERLQNDVKLEAIL